MTNPLRASQTEAVAHVAVMPTMANGADTPAGHSARSGNTKDAYIVPVIAPPVAFDTTHVTSPENRSNPQYGNACHPLAATAHPPAIAFKECQSGTRYMGDVHPTIDANKGTRRQEGVQYGMQVRRLTPRECERLQGQRDDYTLITFNRKPAKDGPRYKALGNSMAVPVMRWIGMRIQLAVECF